MKFIFIIMLAVINFAFADPLPTIHLIHINGIDTIQADAQSNLDNLRLAAKIDSNIVKWDLVYNPTSTTGIPLLSDLKDVFFQKAHEDQQITINQYVDAYMKANNLHYPVNSPEYNALKDTVQPVYESAAKALGGKNTQIILDEFNQTVTIAGENKYNCKDCAVPEIFSSVVDLLVDPNNKAQQIKDYVVLIPHSQGNLYANWLINYFSNLNPNNVDKFAYYGIASPADKIANFGGLSANMMKAIESNPGTYDDYVTSSNDYIINGLRVLWPALPANINIPFSIAHFTGHSLIDTYLADEQTRAQIVKMIELKVWYWARFLQDTPLSQNSRFTVYNAESTNGIALHGPMGMLCLNNACKQKDVAYYMPSKIVKKFVSGIDKKFSTFGGNVAFFPKDKFRGGRYYFLYNKPYRLIATTSVKLQNKQSIQINYPSCYMDSDGMYQCKNMVTNPILDNFNFGVVAEGLDFTKYDQWQIQLQQIFFVNMLIMGVANIE